MLYTSLTDDAYEAIVHGRADHRGVAAAGGRALARRSHLGVYVWTAPAGQEVWWVASDDLIGSSHVWTAPAGQEVWWVASDDLIGSSHVSGLLVRCA